MIILILMNRPLERGTERKLTHKEKLWFSLINGFLFATCFVFVEGFDVNSSQSWFDYFFRLVLFGLLFGYGFVPFTKLLRTRILFSKPTKHEAFEKCIAQGPANCFYGWEAVGGGLLITEENIVFVPNGFNIQNSILEIPLEEIQALQTKKTLKLLNNGLRIKTNQKHYDFVLNERSQWMELFEKTSYDLSH